MSKAWEFHCVETFWQSYLSELAPDSPTRERGYEAGRFGDSPALADELGASILSGAKTATCSALWEYEAEGSQPPQVGDRLVVLGGRGEPLCVIKTTEVEVRAFEEADERFAREEGEGDRSLEYWREAHERFFSRTLPNIGKNFTPKMPLVCERFCVVYR